MAEHINKTDTLNEGRVKLNAAISDSNIARGKAEQADVKSTQALANSESTQTQLDTIVIEGDSSVEAAQARVDEKGEGHATLKARIDDGMNSVNQQLAEITTNINSYSHLVVDGDWTPAVKEASKPNTRLLFPRGQRFDIKSHLLIENIDSLTWDADGALFYDNGKPIILENGNNGKTANGIRFYNCNNLSIPSLTHDGEATRGYKTNDKSVVPQLDFHQCDNLIAKILIKGNPNPNIEGTNSNPNTQGAHELMAFYYVRVYESKNPHVTGSIANDLGQRGEYFGFYKNDYPTFEHFSYFQYEALMDTYSIVKMINCNNGKIRGFKVKSNSSTSFADISGNNITYEDMDIDYPNGVLVDVTNEWGYNNVSSDNIMIRNCKARVNRVVISAIADAINLKPTKKVVIDNVERTNSYNETFNEFVSCATMEHLEIKNLRMHNNLYNNLMAVTPETDILDYQKVIMDNVKITASESLSHSTIETRGLTEVRDSYINLDYNAPLSLRDRERVIKDLRETRNKFVFINTVFENTAIILSANVEFIGCEFINCVFYTETFNGMINPNVYFDDKCIVEFNSVDYDITSTFIFNFANGTIYRFEFHGEIKGKSRLGSVCNDLSNKASIIDLRKIKVNLERYSSDGLEKLQLNQIILLGDLRNGEAKSLIRLDNCDIKGTVVRFTSGTGSNIAKVTGVDSIFYNEGTGGVTQSFSFSGTPTMSSVDLVLVKNTFGSNDVTFLQGNGTFRNLLSEQNILMTPII